MGWPAVIPQLAIFARAPLIGHGKRRLAADIGDHQAWLVSQALLRGVAQALAGWPLGAQGITVHLDGPSAALAGSGLTKLPTMAQSSGSLAQRMTAAFDHHLPHGPTLVMGCDIPLVTADHLTAMAKLLTSSEVCFGPADDGGYWAIGLQSTRYLSTCCSPDLPWSSPRLLTQTLHDLDQHHITCALGPQLRDLDTADDLHWAQAQGFCYDT